MRTLRIDKPVRSAYTPPGKYPHGLLEIGRGAHAAHLLDYLTLLSFTLFSELPIRVLLGNWASGVPIPGNKGIKLRLSEVAEFARLKPLQYQLEGPRVNVGSTRERIIHSPDRE